jgi:nickel-type superoxide dismutase maturation protease
MQPALRPGDRVLVDPRAYRHASPSVGDVVLVRDPEGSPARLIKRIALPPRPVDPGRLWLAGDDPSVSRDSRQFGPVDRELVVGRAWYIYAPADRRGPL